MAGPLNPADISWTPPNKWEDGSDFTPDQLAGYGFGVRPQGSTDDFALVVDVPLSFDVTTLPLADLPLAQGAQEIAMRTLAYNGTTSVWTPGLPIVIDRRVPLPPLGLSAT